MTKADIYTRVTNQIIDAMERGKSNWRMPWHTTGTAIHAPRNAKSERYYRGVNAVSLWAAADVRGYCSGLWATYQQWKELGAQVRRGEKASEIVFWTEGESTKLETEDGEPEKFWVARGFQVFNASQVDGFTAKAIPELSEAHRIESAEAFFSSLNLDVRYGGERAFYNTSLDFIQMPEFSRFRSPAGFYSTLAHETVHWTGATNRLERQFGTRFGVEQYAAEELVAELGAAFLAARIGSFAEPRGNHAGYLARWLKLLRSDKRAIFTAASKAQQAADWLVELSGTLSAAA